MSFHCLSLVAPRPCLRPAVPTLRPPCQRPQCDESGFVAQGRSCAEHHAARATHLSNIASFRQNLVMTLRTISRHCRVLPQFIDEGVPHSGQIGKP